MPHLLLDDSSRVFVDVRSKGVLGALEHALTFAGRPALERPIDGEVAASGPFEAEVNARVAASSLEPPKDASVSDREKMLENLLGKDVLDAKRFPEIALRGRYVGTRERGTLVGKLTLRGEPRDVRFDVDLRKSGDKLVARATWEGTQTSLGIKPFKALLGALRLHDWIASASRRRSTASGSPVAVRSSLRSRSG